MESTAKTSGPPVSRPPLPVLSRPWMVHSDLPCRSMALRTRPTPHRRGLKLGVRAEWSFAGWFQATNTAAARYIIQVGSTTSFVLYILHLTSTAVRIGQAGSAYSDITATNTTVVNEWWHVAMRGYAKQNRLDFDARLRWSEDRRQPVSDGSGWLHIKRRRR